MEVGKHVEFVTASKAVVGQESYVTKETSDKHRITHSLLSFCARINLRKREAQK